VKLLVHIEQYDVVGILPSQLESLTLLAHAFGITDAAYIDNTDDGFTGIGEWTRYASLEDFLANETGEMIAFSPDSGEDVRTIAPSNDAWLCFGPSMGWSDTPFTKWSHVPGGVLNSRDAVPIVVWETSKWQE
jgi:hypothetical protein